MSTQKRTRQHVLQVLARFHHPEITDRDLTEWGRKGYISRSHQGPGRGRGLGRSNALYDDPTIIRRILVVDRLLQWRGKADYIPFALWLVGSDPHIDQARTSLTQQWKMILAGIFDELDDPNDVEERTDRVSHTLAKKRFHATSSLSRDETTIFAEAQAQAFLNPGFEPDDELLAMLSAIIAKEGKNPSEPQPEVMRIVFAFISHYFAAPVLLEALMGATDADLQRARADLMCLLRCADMVFLLNMKQENLTKWEHINIGIWLKLSLLLLGPFLVLHREGKGSLIDMATSFISNSLGSPEALQGVLNAMLKQQVMMQR